MYGLTQVLGNHTKDSFVLSKAFLGESKRLIGRFFNQISSFTVGANQNFNSWEQLTFMLHYRIHGFLTYKILKSEVFSKFTFPMR